MHILEELQQLAEENYKVFNSKVVPTRQQVLGVRMPALRRIARRIAREDPIGFVEQDKHDVYEMIMLEGLVLSYLERPFLELLPMTERFLAKVDNWAQIDATICDFKNIGGEKEAVLKVVRKWLAAEEEFKVRAGLVILLAHFIDSGNLGLVFELSQQVRHSGYYVRMANAWLISVCMAKFPEQTVSFFQSNRLDAWTHNKAIQKSRESYRVSEEHKALIKTLKRKQAGLRYRTPVGH